MRQTIDRPFGITVTGTHVIRVAPDRADLSLEIGFTDPDPAAAIAGLRARAEEVSGFLRGLGEGVHMQTSRLVLGRSEERRGEVTVFLGHRASMPIHVVIDRLDLIDEIMVGAVNAGAGGINSLTMISRRIRAVRAEARRLALENARWKASEMCAALGAKLGPVLHIEELDPGAVADRRHGSDVDLTSIDESEGLVAYDPGTLLLGAAVAVSFGIIT